MNSLIKFGKFIITEIRQGNLLVIGLTVAAYFYIALPMYGKFLDVIDRAGNNSRMTTEVAINVHQLREEIARLKTKVDNDFKKRRAGRVGITSF